MTTLTFSLLKIPIGILTSRQPNIAKTRRSLCALLTITAIVATAYKPPPPRRRPPPRTVTFLGTSETVAKLPQHFDLAQNAGSDKLCV